MRLLLRFCASCAFLRPSLLVLFAAFAGHLAAQPAPVLADPTTGALYRPGAATFASYNNLLTLDGAAGSYLLISTAASTYLPITVAFNSYQQLDADLTSWAAVVRAGGFDTFVATPSSANLASLVTGETGTGALVFGTSPTFTTPTLGAATATSITGATDLTLAGGTAGTSSVVVSNTTAASTTTSGALRVGSNVGLSGNAGGASYFGGTVNAATYRATGSNGTNATSTGILDFALGATRLISYGADASTPGAFSLIGLSSDGTAGTTRLAVNSSGYFAFAGTNQLASSWRAGSLAIGPDGQDKVVIGPLISTTNGPTIGGHSTGLGGWAPINVNGSTVTLRIGESAALSINASSVVSIAASTPSTLTTNGALVVTGGVGVGGVMNVGGAVKIGPSVSSPSISGTGSVTVTTSTTQLSSTPLNTGAIAVVSGYNNSGGSQGAWLIIATSGGTISTIGTANATGLTPTFSVSAGTLQMSLASGSMTVATTLLGIPNL
jgi:hypothetical protein